MSEPPFIAVVLSRIVFAVYSGTIGHLTTAAVFIWDAGLAIYNLLAPNLPPQKVVPEGFAGARGVWPQYVPPQQGDSRGSCPALNAMANHGILPHSGRGITFTELNAKVRATYNFAPSFCFFVPKYAADMLHRNYWTDKFDLSDLDVHNGIEHDASLTREDSIFQRDQAKPSTRLINELLACGTGPGGDLTAADLSRISSKRRAESKRDNPQFFMSTFHKLFGSSNSSTLLTIFGGKIQDICIILSEERLPDGWQPRILHPMGLTMAEFNQTALKVELGITSELPPSFGLSATDKKKA